MKVLTVSFLLEIAGVALLILLPNSSSRDLSPVDITCIFLLVGAGVAFYIALGMLAARLGKSWILWVGLTIITKPIGSIIAYFLMRQRVKDAIRNGMAAAS
jgi:hypothetical protein